MRLSRRLTYDIKKTIQAVKDAVKGFQTMHTVISRMRVQMGNAVTVTRQLGQAISDYIADPANVKQIKKIKRSLMSLHAVSMGWLFAMIRFSPLLGAEVGLLRFEFELMFLEIGNATEPVLRPFINALKDLFHWIRQLPEPVQQFIGLTVVLTAVITGLAIAIFAVQLVSLPLIAAILALAAGIAIIIVIWNNWNKIIEWFNKQSLLMKVIIVILATGLALLFGPLIFIIALIKGIIWLFQNWGDVSKWLGDTLNKAWKAITEGLAKAGEFIWGIIQDIWRWFSNLFGNIADIAGDAWENLKNGINQAGEWIADRISDAADAIWGAFQWVVESVGNLFDLLFGNASMQSNSLVSAIGEQVMDTVKGLLNTMISWVNTYVIGKINDVISALKGYAVGDFHPFGGLSLLGEIPALATGTAYVPHDMLALLHRGEMVVPRPYAEEMRNGMGNVNLNFEIKIENPIFRNEMDVDEMAKDLARRASEYIMDTLNQTTLWSG